MTQPHVLADIPESFFSEIQFELKSCPEDAIRLHLQKAIIEFCELTHYWQEDIGPITIVDSVEEYDIPTTRYFANVSIMEVSYIDENSTEKVILQNCKTPDVLLRYWQETPFTVSFSPIDSLAEKELSILCAIKPVLYGDRFKYSEFINLDHSDAVIAKAKERLYRVPNKEWSDLKQAQINELIFAQKTTDALRKQGRSFSALPDKSVRKARSFY